MLFRNPGDAIDLPGTEAIVAHKFDRLQPEFRSLGIPLNMNVGRFALIAGEKKRTGKVPSAEQSGSRPNDCRMLDLRPRESFCQHDA
jgi:hypothetical protein